MLKATSHCWGRVLSLAVRLRLGSSGSLIRRGILDLTHPGPRDWSGSDLKEAQKTIHDIVESQVDSIKAVVPWFLGNMPAQYFLNVRDALRTQHVKAISTVSNLKHTDLSVKLETFNERNNQKEWSFITVGSDAAKLLERELQQLQGSQDEPELLSSVKVYSSADKQICILIFTFTLNKMFDLTDPSALNGNAMLSRLKDAYGNNGSSSEIMLPTHRHGSGGTVVFSETEMSDYLSKCSPEYLHGINTGRFLVQKDLYQQVLNNEITAVDIRPGPGCGSGEALFDGTGAQMELLGNSYTAENVPLTNATGTTVITVASTNTLPERMVLALAHYLRTQGLEIDRLTLDCIEAPRDIPDHTTGYVLMSQVVVTKANMGPEEMEWHSSHIKRLKWTNTSVVDLGLVRFPFLGMDRAEIITALCALMHGALKPVDPHVFISPSAILDLIASDVKLMTMAGNIADLLLSKFTTAESKEDIRTATRPLLLRCQEDLKYLEAAGGIQENPCSHYAVVALKQMILLVGNISECNINVPNRYALSMAVSTGVIGGPAILHKMNQSRADTVFVYGYNFSAFHCRFGKLSRGGLCVWPTVSKDSYAVEIADHFKNTYEAAYYQNLVNKDVPAAGSKSIIILNPVVEGEDDKDTEFNRARRSVRAFTDSLLDLQVIPRGQVRREFVYGCHSDHVTPSDFLWLYQRMKDRGVTDIIPSVPFRERDFDMNAESLVMFLVSALKQLRGIDPASQSFTVRLMNREGVLNGIMGPGHLLHVLIRDYPSTCKIVSIATGNSVLVDPYGIDHHELLRLNDAGLSVSEFAAGKLSSEGYVMDLTAQETSQQGMMDVMRIKSDVCIPCSPHSHETSLVGDGFLSGSGTVLSHLVMEGAVNAVSPEMLASLGEAGVAVFKASSTLKGYGIATEWEPLASLFHHHANQTSDVVWSQLDPAITDKVRRASSAEADLLCREFKHWSGPLPELSDRTSKAINRLKELIPTLFEGDPSFEKLSMRIFLEDWGFSGVNAFSDEDCTAALPESYRQALMASTLASMFLYREVNKHSGFNSVSPISGVTDVPIHAYTCADIDIHCVTAVLSYV